MTINEKVDFWLDVYRDYKWLYETFGDIQYFNTMEYCLNMLRKLKG